MRKNYLPGNRLTLLESGAAYFPALLDAIHGAQQEIHLEAYIFAADDTGRSVAAALAAAARRGVVVRVLVDGFGARDFAAGLGQTLLAAGAEVLVYRQEAGRLIFRRHRLRRLHRKLSVFDGQIAFVGGINVIDDGAPPNQGRPRFDYAVRIEGPLVTRIHQSLRRVWRLVRWAKMGRRPPPPDRLKPAGASDDPGGTITAGFLQRDNLRHRRDIEVAYLNAIQLAQREILLANAYFLPGRRFRQALMQAARRGVQVTLLLQGRVEYALLHYATQSLYSRLMAAGIHIVEYQAGFLHAKVAVVDGAWATVGSSNIDPFSLLLAREANIEVFDSGFAGELAASLRATMQRSGIEIQSQAINDRPWLVRTFSNLAYGAIRLMMGMTGYVRRGRKNN